MQKRMLARLGGILLAAVTVGGAVSSALALDYPTKVVRIVVPYAPGGSAGAQARTLADELGRIWKQQVIVEDKPGAGTTIGAAYVAGSAPDGYTLYLAGTSHTIASSLGSNIK